MSAFQEYLAWSAELSPCRKYRYLLRRRFAPSVNPGRALGWLMINPSTADETVDDATIRKVIGFTYRAGFGTAVVANLFALRTKDVRDVRNSLACLGTSNTEGPDNRKAWSTMASECDAVCLAWGPKIWARVQARIATSTLRSCHPTTQLVAIGFAKDGSPLHPLMQSYDRGLQDVSTWSPPGQWR